MPINYSRVGIDYSKKAKKKVSYSSKKTKKVDYVNVFLFLLLFVVVILFVLTWFLSESKTVTDSKRNIYIFHK